MIGGVAVAAHGSPSLTGNLDISYARERENLDDAIRIEGAAGQPKDRIELETLGALRDELRGT